MAAAAVRASSVPTPSITAPPTPPFPAFPRLPTSPSVQRNASTSSSRSNNTTSSTTSSLIAAPMRPPPVETRTAATNSSQLPSRPASGSSNDSPSPVHSGRGLLRNGPRSRKATSPLPTSIITSPSSSRPQSQSSKSSSLPLLQHDSPTTPRVSKSGQRETLLSSPVPLRVNVSMPSIDAGPSSQRGREAPRSIPSSPTTNTTSNDKGKQRTLSVDRQQASTRENRLSQASVKSSGTSAGHRKPSLNDYVLGEELGRGSYSTVVQASASSSINSPTSPGPPRQYAIKIIDQAHLVQEKKVKYATIERDALIRLNDIRKMSSPINRASQRGTPNSSSAEWPSSKRLNASIAGASRAASTSKDRLSVVSDSSSSINTSTSGIPISSSFTSNKSGRRPSRSAEPPEMVPERSEEAGVEDISEPARSRPPLPEKQETAPFQDVTDRNEPASPTLTESGSSLGSRGKEAHQFSNQPRRQSLVPSERSVKAKTSPVAHPGIIRLYATFNDSTSLYFVLDLARNGELLGFIRKCGSLDLISARYYAAQLVDTLEFMHDRGVIHRDLKPENILLDDDMRIRITDFGSAKLIGKNGSTVAEEGKKRSFVGSADFVSPEVLRNEPVVLASDIWAFGCILYQLIVGRPPFRGATDYLTFRRILERELSFPDGFDAEARSLIELILVPDPTRRPTASDIKSHPFFSVVDFATIWTCLIPTMSTGLTKPVSNTATVDLNSEVWAVFEDEVSDEGFEYDDPRPDIEEDHRRSPLFDRDAAADALRNVGRKDVYTFEPPRPAFADAPNHKARGWSSGSRSVRTSSSSSNNRSALTGLLETMGMMGISSGSSNRAGSGRVSRTSDRSEEMRARELSTQPQTEDQSKWAAVLLANETIIFTSSVSVRPPTSIPIPSFLMPAPRRRQLILTDFPRLILVKDDDPALLKVKSECIFAIRPKGSSSGSGNMQVGGNVANRVVDLQEKGTKGFIVQIPSGTHTYFAESSELRTQWVQALRRIVA